MHNDALNTLRFHCAGRFDLPCNRAGIGFIGKLRPFTEISETDFEEIVMASETIYQSTNGDSSIEKDAIYQLADCAHQLYVSALANGAKLFSNKLIDIRQRKMIECMFSVLMEIVIQLSNPHNRSNNGQSPLQIYKEYKESMLTNR